MVNRGGHLLQGRGHTILETVMRFSHLPTRTPTYGPFSTPTHHHLTPHPGDRQYFAVEGHKYWESFSAGPENAPVPPISGPLKDYRRISSSDTPAAGFTGN
jgi:hypothetical protein